MSVSPRPIDLFDEVRVWLSQPAWRTSEHFTISQLVSALETPDDAFVLRALDTPLSEEDGDILAYIAHILYLAPIHPDTFTSFSDAQLPTLPGESFKPLGLADLCSSSNWSPYLFLSRLLCASPRAKVHDTTATTTTTPRKCERRFTSDNSVRQICRLLHELGDRTTTATTDSKKLASQNLCRQMERTRQRLWIERVKRETLVWQQQVGYAQIAPSIRMAFPLPSS